jgi:hypothetical protein
MTAKPHHLRQTNPLFFSGTTSTIPGFFLALDSRQQSHTGISDHRIKPPSVGAIPHSRPDTNRVPDNNLLLISAHFVPLFVFHDSVQTTALRLANITDSIAL